MSEQEREAAEACEAFIRTLGLGPWPTHRQIYAIGYLAALTARAPDSAGEAGPVAIDALWAKIENYADAVAEFNEMLKLDLNNDKVGKECIALEKEIRAALAAPHPVGSALTEAAFEEVMRRAAVPEMYRKDMRNGFQSLALAAAPAPADPAKMPSAKWGRLYTTANTLVAHIGYKGEIDALADEVASLMDALHELDGGEWMPGLSPAVKGYHPGVSGEQECDVPPFGWRCTRAKGHEGPCAAIEDAEGPASVERGMKRLRDAGFFVPNVVCPVCASVAGQPCTDFMGKVRPEPHAERRKVTAAAPSHPPATTEEGCECPNCANGMGLCHTVEADVPAVAVQAEPSELLRQRANEIASMAKPEYFNKVRAAVLAISAHPKPAAPATAEDAVSDEAIIALYPQFKTVEPHRIIIDFLPFARAVLALRSGASAQPAGGAK